MAETLLLVHYGEDWIRGSERCLLDLMAHMDCQRYRPLLWTNSPALLHEAHKLGVEGELDEFPLLLGWRAPRFDITGYARLRRKARELIAGHDVRLIHVNSAAPCQWLVPVARALSLPLLCHLHARYLPRDRYTLRVHGASRLIGVSSVVLEAWSRDGVPPHHLGCIPNGVDLPRLMQASAIPLRQWLELSPDTLLMAAVGSLIPRKGIDRLFEAMSLAREAGAKVHLALLGSGPEEAQLRALAEERGIAPHVSWLGEQPEVGRWLRGGVDLVVSGAREEVFGLTLAEAAALGLPTLAFRVGGIPEVVQHDRTGLLCPDGDTAAMAGAMLHLVEPTVRQRLGEAGREHALRHFTMARYVGAIEREWQRLLNSRPEPGPAFPGLWRWLGRRIGQGG
ncbi:glycosyltransferase family 4 protein [Aeromonas schubertii]|uniref:Glycosyltransferase family 4 protein n=1 Tax=Aeromonas schubertii TaxID=652 RepID=A0ABS7V8U9_9GAMM|nr:glycosyltransferase family 4 protein [Aeromonas schubertii]MBZ6065807.1 glycosyltransferase family 4 protein [Aeromonas schubertii]